MNTTEIPLDERIRTFADSVRAHLDDLPADEVDDIIIGLTADLADQAADAGGVLELGDPATYAAELRAAAGLPERSDAATRESVRERVSRRLGYLAAGVRRSAFGAWMLDLLIALRPVWWVLRGFGLYAVVAVLLAATSFGVGWPVLLAITLVSVQWGRNRWLPKNALRHTRTVVSVVAVIALPFALVSVLVPRVEYVNEDPFQQPGLLLDGVQVGNIFAYDESGELIDGVQLYTDRGTPLDLYGKDAEANGIEYGWKDDALVVPFTDSRGTSIWNIYPLKEGERDEATGEVRTARPTPAAPPFLRAPGLLTPMPTPTPTP
jgi:uncharacterized membrane protein